MARRSHILVISIVWILLAASCRSVLGLEDYQGAVTVLCGCDQELPDFGTRDCQTLLEERLGSATETTRAAWLAHFSDLSCMDDCSQAYGCYQMKGTCTPTGDSCEMIRECCGHFDEQGSCEADGRCPKP